MNSRDRAHALQKATQDYRNKSSGFYDEVVDEVARRAQESGAIGKSDIGALLTWKRLRADTPWVRLLMNTPEASVRQATTEARNAATSVRLPVEDSARDARAALASLPGFIKGDALASAVIYALAPNRMAVYDRRAHRGIELLDLPLSAKPGRYGRYMALVHQLCEETKDHGLELSPREVDLALFTLGNPNPAADV